MSPEPLLLFRNPTRVIFGTFDCTIVVYNNVIFAGSHRMLWTVPEGLILSLFRNYSRRSRQRKSRCHVKCAQKEIRCTLSDAEGIEEERGKKMQGNADYALIIRNRPADWGIRLLTVRLDSRHLRSGVFNCLEILVREIHMSIFNAFPRLLQHRSSNVAPCP